MPTYAEGQQPSEDTVLNIELTKSCLDKTTTYIGEEGNYSERQKKPPFHEGAFLYTPPVLHNGR